MKILKNDKVIEISIHIEKVLYNYSHLEKIYKKECKIFSRIKIEKFKDN